MSDATEDERLLIQRNTEEADLLNKQADADDAETARLRKEYEEAGAALDKDEAAYFAMLDKQAAEQPENAEFIELQKQRVRNEAYLEASNDPDSAYNIFMNVEREDYEQQHYNLSYNELKDAFLKTQEKRNSLIAKGNDLQKLGLIPLDASDEDKTAFVTAITTFELQKTEKLDKLFKRADPSLREKVERHKALVKAHNEFQATHQNAIMQFRFGFKASPYSFDFRQVDTRYNMAKNLAVVRLYSHIEPPDGDAGDFIPYKYNTSTKAWEAQSTTWKNAKRGDPVPPDDYNYVKFYIKGLFPDVSWMPVQQYNTSSFSSILEAFFPGSFKGQVGTYNKKRSYQKCQPGYWFYERLPEESATCVYMGGSMADTGPSYYPQSTTFDYRIDESNTSLAPPVKELDLPVARDHSEQEAINAQQTGDAGGLLGNPNDDGW